MSSFSVSSGKVFTQVRRSISGQQTEVCIALDAETGQELWATPLGVADYPDGGVGSDDGPRSTPTVEGAFVYVLTSYLKLACLKISDGQVVWSRDLVADYGGTVVAWQNAASPLLEAGLIFVNGNSPGRRFLALHASDGSEAWKGQDDPMTQATPVVATIGTIRQVVFFAQSGLVSVRRDTGSFLWRYPFSFSVATAASPVISGDMVYCSAAYGVGAGALHITNVSGQLQTNEAWRTPGASMNHWATPVCLNGFLYGVYGQAGSSTSLRCLELATGNEMWRHSGPGSGGVLAVGGLILLLAENGNLVLVNPDVSAYTEAAQFRALDGQSSSIPGLAVKCWNVPAISNGRLYVRSTTEAVCLDVAPATPPALTLSGGLSADSATLQLLIGNTDGSPFDTNRAGKIDLLATTNLSLGQNGWVRVTNSLTVTNNQLLFRSALNQGISPVYYFRTQERP